MTGPTPDHIFPVGAVVPAAATASDPDLQGAITKVEFRVDNGFPLADSTAPYGWNFSRLLSGYHTITVTAVDNGSPPQSTTVTVPFRIG